MERPVGRRVAPTNPIVCVDVSVRAISSALRMFRQVRFDCGACGDGFVDWHDDEWQRAPVYCVNCGAAIVAGAPVEPTPFVAELQPLGQRSSGSALGVLKAGGEGFRDTLPGLKDGLPCTAAEAQGSVGSDPEASDSETSESNRDTVPPQRPRAPARAGSQAASSPPKPIGPSLWERVRKPRSLAPVAALLLGFAAGVPAALLAENPLLRLINPAAYERLQLSEEMAAASNAIDDRDWDRAREILNRCASMAPAADRRLATLRARLTLGLILANRAAEAGRELAAVQKLPSGGSAAAELRRVYDALFPAKPAVSAAPSAPSALPSPAAVPAKVVVTKRELLSFARDRQHRARLDDAERLYAEVLRSHPNDAEARCGLAEVQILRGGMDDAAGLFERALTDNPSYLPAWVGLGDVDWLRGRPERAACRYRAVIDRFPASSYPPYIARRLEQVTNSGVNPPRARDDGDAVNACGE